MSTYTSITVNPDWYVSPGSMQAYATQQTSAANSYIVQLGIASAALVPPTITPEFPTVANPPPVDVEPVPAFQTVVWTAPAMPSYFSGELDTSDLFPEPFDDNPPALVFPAAPVNTVGDIPDEPAVNYDYVYPELDLSLPVAPSLLTLNIHAFNGITIPTFTDTIPELNVVAPSLVPYTPGDMYTSALLTAVKNSLEDRITNGGTGLDPAVENAIWDRGREREYRQMADALAELDRMETLGYALPPGGYVDARIKIQTEMGNASNVISREIMIKQAELEQTNVLKALDQAVALEAKLMDYTNAVEQRVFESCKYATEAGISIYNARVQAYAAFVDAYKSKVQAYEALIRGEIAKVEAYKAEVEAESAKAQINTALVNQYKVQADVALSAIEVYKAEIGAIQTKAQIEKLKVEIYGEQVRAYSAQVNAYTAGVEGFRAQIQGETAKQEAFKAQVDAYAAQVTAAAKQADARIAEYRGLIEAKNSEWEAYKAAADAESSKARAVAANNQSIAEAYRATVSGNSAFNEVLTKQWQVALDQAQRVTEIGVAAAKANAELYMTTRSLSLDAAKVGAQVSAQLGAAALNSLNFSQSSSFSQSISQSTSTVYQYSASV